MQKKYFLNYSNKKYNRQRRICTFTAYLFGKFDAIYSCTPKDVNIKFYNENIQILSQERGNGYWLWKPYLILEKLHSMNTGDILMYCDSGCVLIKNPTELIELTEKYNQDIIGFELSLIEHQWSKKELTDYMNSDDDDLNSPQIITTVFIVKKSEKSMAFFEEFLELSKNEILLTDKHIPEYIQHADYITHRHDQSIFSLLYKKYKLIPFKDPTQYGKYPNRYSGLTNPNSINLTKNVIHTLSSGRKLIIKDYIEDYPIFFLQIRKLAFIRHFLSYIKHKLFSHEKNK
ncbi:hypothetical protein [Providencia sp. PROV146]|uniref:hypothetical protein n=1 Tax=Providencia sp. PROV146 TaxID=2949856 RepID=UPI002349B07D|nr:hypothetical protein [Providencia sp. PROV146]